MAERITIKDIAKALDMHHSTVSRALRNDSRVKEETRKLVADYANEHGYQINMLARELRGEKRNTVAVVVPNINHQFFSNVVSYFTNVASQQGYVVSIFQTNEDLEREKQIIDTIIQYNFAGVVASLSIQSFDTKHFEKLERNNIPLVMFDRISNDLSVPKVTINNAEVVKDAVLLFAEEGRKRIAHISGPTGLNVFNDRQEGYQRGIDKAGLEYHKTITIRDGFNLADGIVVAKELFKEEIPPDAIICDSSNIIFGLLREMKEIGLKTPQDVALISFGLHPLIEVLEPAIGNIVQPEMEIARITLELLMSRIKNNTEEVPKTVVLAAKIIKTETY